MTERELFEAIGHVDDDLILAADAPVKKRRRVVHLHWQQVVSVAACACIVLGGAAVWRSGALRKSSIAGEAAMAADVPEAAAETAPAPDMPMLDAAAPQAADADEGAAVEKDSAASGIALGLAQCVQIDGVLYFDTGSAVDCPPDRGADGVIKTSVDRDAFPETDGCSNFGTGYSYWVTEDGVVIVEIDGVYYEFAANSTAEGSRPLPTRQHKKGFVGEGLDPPGSLTGRCAFAGRPRAGHARPLPCGDSI